MSEQFVDVLAVLQAIPGNHLILLPDSPRFTIAAVTDAYLRVTYTHREDILGKGVFEALTDDVENLLATGVANLSASLHDVVQHKRPHRMADQRYDVYNAQLGRFVYKVWEPVNKPVLTKSGDVQYIIHTVKDVTQRVELQEENQQTQQKLAQSESRFREAL
ncbi:hypothetical protein BH09BAC4_BH09BAC4_03810 [soil metagenome]